MKMTTLEIRRIEHLDRYEYKERERERERVRKVTDKKTYVNRARLKQFLGVSLRKTT